MRKNEKIEVLVMINIILFNIVLLIIPVSMGSQEKDGLNINDGLVSHWDFNEGSGSTLRDCTNSHNGTIFGEAEWTNGISGNSLKLDGLDDFIRVPNHIDFDFVTTHTISAWIYFNDLPQWQTIIAKTDGSSQRKGWDLCIDGVNQRLCIWYISSSNNYVHYFSECLSSEGWTHIALTYSPSLDLGNKVKFFINGVESIVNYEQVGSFDEVGTNDFDVCIGNYNGGSGLYPLNGKIDEIRVYERVLDLKEIEFIYNLHKPEDLGIVSYWNFNDITGDITKDISGNGNDATIFGAEYITDTPKGSGYSLKFKRSDKDYIYTPIYQMPVQSICLWFKLNTQTSGGPIASSHIKNDNRGNFVLNAGYDDCGMAVRGIDRWEPPDLCAGSGPNDYLDNTWHHVAFVSSGQTHRLYIDGELKDTHVGSMLTDRRVIYLGLNAPDQIQSSYWYEGLLDEVKIYSRALSGEEIQALYEECMAVLPSADFKVNKTNHPEIFSFAAIGENLDQTLLQWDFDGDGIWDRTGGFDEVSTALYKYSSPGLYRPVLKVTNDAGSNSSQLKLAVMSNYSIKCSNKGFFLSYPTSALLPPLKNKYFFCCPQGILHTVVFQLGDHMYAATPADGDENIDCWEAVIHMNEGDHNDRLRIFGYDAEEDLVWHDDTETFIVNTPLWFDIFLLMSDVTIYNSERCDYWNMTVVPTTLGLGYRMENISVDFIGGPYGVNATVSGPQKFRIESNQELTVYYPLCSLNIPLLSKNDSSEKPVDLGSYQKVDWNYGLSFAASADVELNPEEVSLAGCLRLTGEAGVSFDIPLVGIPFLAEAGLTGGIDAEFGTHFIIARFAENGFTFCPEDFSEVFFDFKGHGGLYAQVLMGLARLEGGLFAEGRCDLKLPSLQKHLKLYGGVYAKASCLIWSAQWSSSIEFDSSEQILKQEENTTRFHSDTTMDLLCLNEGNTKGHNDRKSPDILAENVVGTAHPQLVFAPTGEGLLVWTDLSNLDENRCQSDIWYATYDPADGWSNPIALITEDACEFNPVVTRIRNVTGHCTFVMVFNVVRNVIDGTDDIETFYEAGELQTAVWSPESGWSMNDQVITVPDGAINAMDVSSATTDTVYLTYLFDTDTHPWEVGEESLWLQKGYLCGSSVNWESARCIQEEGIESMGSQSSASFVAEGTGGVALRLRNESTGRDEIVFVGLQKDECISRCVLQSADTTIDSVSCCSQGDRIIVSWLEDYSSLYTCELEVRNDDQSSEWHIVKRDTIYEGASIAYAQPVGNEKTRYYLCQIGEERVPSIIEQLDDGSWGRLRQISLGESYSMGDIDGDATAKNAHLVCLRETPVSDWRVGHWRFDEGNSSIVHDSSSYGNTGIIVEGISGKVDGMWRMHHGGEGDLPKEYGYYLAFDQDDGRVQVSDREILDTPEEFTVSAWIQLDTSSSQGQVLFEKEGAWRVYEQRGFLHMVLWEEEGVDLNVSSFPLQQWCFVACRYDHGMVTVSLFSLDEEICSYETALSSDTCMCSENPLYIGGFAGFADEICVFNRALTKENLVSLWFSPYASLGSQHDILTQPFPVYAYGTLAKDKRIHTLSGKNPTFITTEKTVIFTGYPEGLLFSWDFDDGCTIEGSEVCHRFLTEGFYTVVCKAKDPLTGVVTPFTQKMYVFDATPPFFKGLTQAAPGDGEVFLQWKPAEDSSFIVRYEVYLRREEESFDFTSPYHITNDTSVVLSNLTAGIKYSFVVRARDAAGNRDANIREMTVVPFDHTPPVFEGVSRSQLMSNSPRTIFLEWEKASDASSVVYRVYCANKSGGQNFSNPLCLTVEPWCLLSNVTDDMVYVVVRAQDCWGNQENNTRERAVILFVDAHAPVIHDVSVTPPVQGSGSPVYISCNVTDETQIEAVYACMTGRLSTTVFEMDHISFTDRYHVNISSLIPGVFALSIVATDTWGNENISILSSLTILDVTPPEIFDVRADPPLQAIGLPVNLSCRVRDNGNVDHVKVVITTPQDEVTNTSMIQCDEERFYYNTTFHQEGIYKFFIWTNDSEKNTNISLLQEFYVRHDVLPPTTTVLIGNPTYSDDNEWINSSTELRLVATDDLSGVAKIYLRCGRQVEGTSQFVTSDFKIYDGPFHLLDEGVYCLEFFAVDNIGNVEDIRQQWLHMDDTPPITSAVMNYGGHDPPCQPVPGQDKKVVVLTAVDDGVGVSHLMYRYQYKSGWSAWMKTKNSMVLKPNSDVLSLQFYAVDLLQQTETVQDYLFYGFIQ
jgi:PKD repeat protein